MKGVLPVQTVSKNVNLDGVMCDSACIYEHSMGNVYESGEKSMTGAGMLGGDIWLGSESTFSVIQILFTKLAGSSSSVQDNHSLHQTQL